MDVILTNGGHSESSRVCPATALNVRFFTLRVVAGQTRVGVGVRHNIKICHSLC